MFGFFKKKKDYSGFATLNEYAGKNAYFVRIASWGLVDRRNIFVIDPDSGKAFTLDPWPQMVFIAADGMLTVGEYVLKVAEKYKDGVPGGLDKAIINELITLLNYKIIKLSDKKGAPAKEFDQPGKHTH